MKFKKDDKVTLRNNSECWIRLDDGFEHQYGPKFGEIVTVDGYGDYEFCCFLEYNLVDPIDNDRHYYPDEAFEKVVSDELLIEQLEQVAEPFTVSR